MWTSQFVYPAYTTMIGNLRSEALENFKSRLEHSLNEGEGFAVAVYDCTHSCMLDFDQGCAGNVRWDRDYVTGNPATFGNQLYFRSALHVTGISSAFILSLETYVIIFYLWSFTSPNQSYF